MAIICRDPDVLKEYYCRWFGFEELNRIPDGSMYLTDGYLNVDLLQKDSELASKEFLRGHFDLCHDESHLSIAVRSFILDRFLFTVRLFIYPVTVISIHNL